MTPHAAITTARQIRAWHESPPDVWPDLKCLVPGYAPEEARAMEDAMQGAVRAAQPERHIQKMGRKPSKLVEIRKAVTREWQTSAEIADAACAGTSTAQAHLRQMWLRGEIERRRESGAAGFVWRWNP